MSDAGTNLTIDKLKELLLSAGPNKAAEPQGCDCVRYDFRKARYFNAADERKLKDFAERSAKITAAGFGSFFGSNFEVSLSAIEQQYLSDYIKAKPQEGGSLYLGITGDGQNTAGFVEVPQDAAISWLKEILGESETQAEGVLSALEQSFLVDIVSIFVSSLASCEKSLGLKSIGSILKERPQLKIEPTEVLCIFGFDVKKSTAENKFHINIIIIAARLDSAAGRNQQGQTQSSGNVPADVILYHIGDCIVPLTIQFEPTLVTLEEVVGVQADDIIVLDKTISDGAVIYLSGTKLFNGSFAKVGAKRAVVITDKQDS